MKTVFSPIFKAAIFLLFSLAAGTSAMGQDRYAILVGVSGYPDLSEDARLDLGVEDDPTRDGPANDVSAMRQTLLHRGFAEDNILVLADGIAGTALPTRDNIIDAFKTTADRLVPGNDDFVFVFLAGHGSQQPVFQDARAGVEPDGMDEVFLPYDVKPWDEERQRLPNALLDNEIGSLLAILRNRGAFVWMVADTCHSATLTRASLGEDVQFRALDLLPRSFAATRNMSTGVTSSSQEIREYLEPVELTETAGGFIGFFAAQAHQSAPQARLPRAAEQQQTQGWFTFAFNAVVAAEPTLTYGQLSQRILDTYNAEFISRFVTPYYEGTDEFQHVAIFENTSKDAQPQWQVRKDFHGNLLLAAGMLHGIGEGTELAVFQTAAGRDDEFLGYVTVSEAKATEAIVEQSAPVSEAFQLPARAWARLVAHEPVIQLRVALAHFEQAGRAAERDVRAALRSIEARDNFITVVDPGEPSDVTLTYDGQRLEFLVAGGEETRLASYGKSVPALVDATLFRQGEKAALRQEMRARLSQIYKAALLDNISARFAAGSALDGATAEMALCAANAEGCVMFDEIAGEVPGLVPGDTLQLSITNTEFDLIDYTVVHIDSDLTITAVAQGRLTKSDDPQKIMEGAITPDATGAQQLVSILVEGRPGEETTNFAFLEQPRPFLWDGIDAYAPQASRSRADRVAERSNVKIFQWQTK